MCIGKEEFKELADIVAKVKHDTGNIRQTQMALGNAVGDIETHLKKLNSRTGKVEHKVENLEDPLRREGYCVQRDVVHELKDTMLTVERFERHIVQDREDRRDERNQILKQQEAHDRKQLMYIKILGAIITAAALAVNVIPLIR